MLYLKPEVKTEYSITSERNFTIIILVTVMTILYSMFEWSRLNQGHHNMKVLQI